MRQFETAMSVITDNLAVLTWRHYGTLTTLVTIKDASNLLVAILHALDGWCIDTCRVAKTLPTASLEPSPFGFRLVVVFWYWHESRRNIVSFMPVYRLCTCKRWTYSSSRKECLFETEIGIGRPKLYALYLHTKIMKFQIQHCLNTMIWHLWDQLHAMLRSLAKCWFYYIPFSATGKEELTLGFGFDNTI